MSSVRFNPSEPLVLVRAKFFGKTEQTLRMVLDTGATYVSIPWKIASSLGLKPELSEKKVEMTTATGVKTVPLVEIENIEFGGKIKEAVPVLVHDLPKTAYVEGLLGLSFLRNFNLHINFREGYLEIE